MQIYQKNPKKADDHLCYFGEHLPNRHSKAQKMYYEMLFKQIEAILCGKQKSGWDVSYEEAILCTIRQILEESI